MHQIPAIRSVAAGFLLILFALSITSKRALHDLLADHTDWAGICVEGKGDDHIKATGFVCKCGQFVAESPFVEDERTLPPVVYRSYRDYTSFYSSDYLSRYTCYFLQRGPPAC